MMSKTAHALITAAGAALVVLAGVGCDSKPSTPAGPPSTILSTRYSETADEGFLEVHLVPPSSDAATVKAALQAAHDEHWKHRPNPAKVGHSGATKPITRFQAWAWASAESWSNKKDPKLGSIHHMGESSQVELDIAAR